MIDDTNEAIRRNWNVIASHADVAAKWPMQHNMDAYVEITKRLEAIKSLILSAPADDFARIMNKGSYSDE